ncbi:MAG TPA: glycosyltransferase family 2 protein [Chitinophagaceae bacterium]|nr:glycosyltransferase family 2 protein [Chitinophagaceae bacterium]
MRISIITVVYNRVETIEAAIKSVLSQEYEDIEYIVVDGGSTDGTLSIINKYLDHIHQFITEKDEGMYDALNKGIKLATGDIIGVLHADDRFASTDVINRIVTAYNENKFIDAVYGDIAFVNNSNPLKVVRYYSSSIFKPALLTWGFIPAHPTFFCKRTCFQKFGMYKTDFEIAADYELLLRFFKVHKINAKYLPFRFTNMNLGGKSTNSLLSTIKINREIVRACRENNVNTNYVKLYIRYFYKLKEFLMKEK